MQHYQPVTIVIVVLLALLTGCGERAHDTISVEFVRQWGSAGTGDGQFLYLEDFAFDGQGRLLVTDALRADVQVFTTDGRFVTKSGGKGDRPRSLVKPERIAVDKIGNVYVVDYFSGERT